MMKRYAVSVQRMLTLQLKAGFKKIKPVGTEEFIATSSTQKSEQDNNLNVNQFNGDKHDRTLRNEKPVPVSPLLGPYNISNPVIGEKKYFWCSCGLSTSQPFCDGKHKGTSFVPFKFTVEEAVESMNLCGCKFTTTVPFCDQKTCKCIDNN